MIVLGCNGFTRVSEIFAEHFGAVGTEWHYLLGHDAGASLLVDGELVAAVEEERLNREKKTSDFPINAVKWCLESAGLQFSDIDLIAIPWNFSAEVLDGMRLDITSTPMAPSAKLDLISNIGELFTGAVGHDAIIADFAARTGFTPDPDKVVFVPHHLAHAMTGYYMAGMEDAAFLVSDGRAERFSSLIGEIRDGRIRVFDESTIGAEYSIGLLFAVITRYLGFVPNNDEYKIMGLSGFAEPPAPNPFLEHIVELHEDGRYTFCRPLETDNPRSFDPLFGQYFGPVQDTLEYKARVAAAAQEMLTVVTSVALNCLNNTPLFEGARFDDMEVSFGASDAGIAIGAAVHAWVNHPDNAGREKSAPPVTPYLGPEYDDSTIEQALREFGGRVVWSRLSDDEVVAQVAELLTEKVVIGWYEGRIEHGLGHWVTAVFSRTRSSRTSKMSSIPGSNTANHSARSHRSCLSRTRRRSSRWAAKRVRRT